jgi:YfiH family protein
MNSAALTRQISRPRHFYPRWPAPLGVKALITLREKTSESEVYGLGNYALHVGDDPQSVQSNRQRLRTLLPGEPHWLNQVHGSRVQGIQTQAQQPTHPSCDGSWTRVRDLPLAILTADCLPILLTDIQGETIAALHGGWRGLAAGILNKGLDPFHHEVLAWIGPGIGPESYEIDSKVREPFLSSHPEAEAAFRNRGRKGHWQMDLRQAATLILRKAGVQRIHGLHWDTYAQPRLFFSHRRSNPTGRMATVIWKEASEK